MEPVGATFSLVAAKCNALRRRTDLGCALALDLRKSRVAAKRVAKHQTAQIRRVASYSKQARAASMATGRESVSGKGLTADGGVAHPLGLLNGFVHHGWRWAHGG